MRIDKTDPDYKAYRNGIIIMIILTLIALLGAYQNRDNPYWMNEPRRVIIVGHE